MPTVPPKLKPGDEVRVVAPATSLSFIAEDQRKLAEERLAAFGLRVSFAAHVEEIDLFYSSPVESRVSDIHAAFLDPGVSGVMTVLGGYSSNQLLPRLDFDLIRETPKVFCGFSDITALHNAMLAKADLVTYYGPHFSSLGMRDGLEYTTEYLEKAVMSGEGYEIRPADHWSDDLWHDNQDRRLFEPNEGYRILNRGEAEGRLVGGHLGTLALLFGTGFLPDLRGSILMIEADNETGPQHFDRELQALVMQPGFGDVSGLVIGRFQRDSQMDPDVLDGIVHAKPELSEIPVVADASFGHTTPTFTFPLGGRGRLRATADGSATLRVL
ncbi:S66 family peptidase [Rubrobacter indicoceani]|uniref:S66 family peptidase n=1 Tax=Rubrobacter indicoceani TaxID=2051957 RepID=UPI000E5BF65C|nr:S66 peptidase family protein [Rubrobacter indicoceani]